jgi:hypothetical protein
MSSLIEELQRDALDRRPSVGELLRKAKTIAVKLDLPDLEKWVEKELNGYLSEDVPDYRIVVGQVQFLHPTRGWRPVVFPNSEMEEMISKRQVFQRAAELENLVAACGEAGGLQIPLPAEAKALLMELFGYRVDFTVAVPVSSVVGILDAVRNAMLDWALKLEKSGVMGQGMSFSADERKRAREVTAIYNIGSIGTFQGNMGSGRGNFSVQGNTINTESKAAIEGLIGRIRASESQLGLERASAQKLREALASLEQEIEKGKSSGTRVTEFLASIRNIAEGAVGSLAAQGILYEVSKLMR